MEQKEMNSEAMKGKEQSIMSGGAEMEREKRERTEGRETREEISKAVSDGFHVSTSGAGSRRVWLDINEKSTGGNGGGT